MTNISTKNENETTGPSCPRCDSTDNHKLLACGLYYLECKSCGEQSARRVKQADVFALWNRRPEPVGVDELKRVSDILADAGFSSLAGECTESERLKWLVEQRDRYNKNAISNVYQLQVLSGALDVAGIDRRDDMDAPGDGEWRTHLQRVELLAKERDEARNESTALRAQLESITAERDIALPFLQRIASLETRPEKEESVKAARTMLDKRDAFDTFVQCDSSANFTDAEIITLRTALTSISAPAVEAPTPDLLTARAQERINQAMKAGHDTLFVETSVDCAFGKSDPQASADAKDLDLVEYPLNSQSALSVVRESMKQRKWRE